MPDNSLNFEKSLEELEKIVNTLENNDISLDKAIELFEKGIVTGKCISERLLL